MGKSAIVQARIEPELKKNADAVLEELGIKASAAISLFYSQIVRHGGIPLELKIPNEETVAAIKELKSPKYRKQAKRYDSAESLFDDILD